MSTTLQTKATKSSTLYGLHDFNDSTKSLGIVGIVDKLATFCQIYRFPFFKNDLF